MHERDFLTDADNPPEAHVPTLIGELARLGLRKATKRELLMIIVKSVEVERHIAMAR